MRPKKLRIPSAITTGILALPVTAITAGSGTGHTAKRAALATQGNE
jgi:hypothetical protein